MTLAADHVLSGLRSSMKRFLNKVERSSEVIANIPEAKPT
jgi:hypothetical protein